MKLTDTECRKAQPKEKRYRLSDENGLSLLVTPSGQKYWNIRFTVLGERKSESLGLYPDMSLKKARELALELKYKYSKSVLHEDIQPFFKEVAEDWFENQRETWSSKHISNVRASYDDAIYHSDLELCLWGVWSEVHNSDKAKDIRIRSSLVSPETSNALWRSLQSAESSYSYHLPGANDEHCEIEEGKFTLKGWITESEIDLSNFDNDLWGVSLRYDATKPSKEIISLMNLQFDSLRKNWFCDKQKVMNLTIWGTYKNENYEYSNGYKLIVNKNFILDLLDKINMDMIISVDIDRRYKYGSYQSKEDEKELDKYLPSSKRVYLLKKNGDMYVY
ncbi:DUF4102 domain-containing protein [Acinetobacter gyllenbergii]|nr:DUF4102 domain-containing protein [Acinetobacter gyllenbergii]